MAQICMQAICIDEKNQAKVYLRCFERQVGSQPHMNQQRHSSHGIETKKKLQNTYVIYNHLSNPFHLPCDQVVPLGVLTIAISQSVEIETSYFKPRLPSKHSWMKLWTSWRIVCEECDVSNSRSGHIRYWHIPPCWLLNVLSTVYKIHVVTYAALL